jgi:hypothetical protein
LATDPQPQPGVRANHSHRKKTSPLRFLIPIALVALAIGLFLALRGDGVDLPIIGDGPDDTVPAFSFRVTKIRGVATSENADLDALNSQAADVTDEISPVLDELFTAAFLDPGNWRDGEYEAVWDFFADDARSAAESSVETLTLGTTAGDVYETVVPEKSTLAYEVLFDPQGSPDPVVVRFRFTALGEGTDGTYTEVVSVGQLFMGDLDGWKVTAFDVEREDARTEPPAPAPSDTASPAA